MKHIQRYVLGLVAVLALAGCSSHHHHWDGRWREQAMPIGRRGSRTWHR